MLRLDSYPHFSGSHIETPGSEIDKNGWWISAGIVGGSGALTFWSWFRNISERLRTEDVLR
jgi:hypothetical protein